MLLVQTGFFRGPRVPRTHTWEAGSDGGRFTGAKTRLSQVPAVYSRPGWLPSVSGPQPCTCPQQTQGARPQRLCPQPASQGIWGSPCSTQSPVPLRPHNLCSHPGLCRGCEAAMGKEWAQTHWPWALVQLWEGGAFSQRNQALPGSPWAPAGPSPHLPSPGP